MVSSIRCLHCLLILLSGTACSYHGGAAPAAHETWSALCTVTTNKIEADLRHPLMQAARSVISRPELKDSIAIYSQHKRFYKHAGGMPDTFLATLCGEYRDEIPLLRRKLEMLARLQVPQAGRANLTEPSLATEFSMDGYKRLVLAMQSISSRRLRSTASLGAYMPGAPGAPTLPGLSVCEFDYLRQKYLRADDHRFDVDEYLKRWSFYLLTAADRGSCSASDLDTFVTFRGDGILTPLSTEANAMIAESRMFAQNCRNISERQPDSDITDEQCRSYYANPHAARLAAAKGVASALLHFPKEYERSVSQTSAWITFIRENVSQLVPTILIPKEESSFRQKAYALRREAFDLGGTTSASALLEARRKLRDELQAMLISPTEASVIRPDDVGHPRLHSSLPLTAGAMNWDAWRRLAILVDRHTDFLGTDYLNVPGAYLSTAYAPLSPSSYYLHQSHKFTFRGFGAGLSPLEITEGKMHWMYLMRVPKDRIFTAADLLAGQWPDLTTDWLDERTLGTTFQGRHELAWVKLGAPDERELENLVWLGELDVDDDLRNVVSALE